MNQLFNALINPQPEVDPYEWMRNAAAGKIESCPVYDLAVEITTELEREIVHRDTPWHDISLHDIVAGIMREHFQRAQVEGGAK